MTTNDDRETFIDQLAARIRAEVDRRRANRQEKQSTAVKEREESVPIDWSRVTAELGIAEEHGRVFTTTPVMNHYTGLKRIMANLVGKAILYLAQVYTKHQEAFNLSIVHALRSSNEGLKQLEQYALENRKRLGVLPGVEANIAEVERIIEALPDFERRLVDLAARIEVLPNIENRLDETARHVEILKQEIRLAEIVHRLEALSKMEQEISQITKRIEELASLDHSVAEMSSRLVILPALERRIEETTHRLEQMQGLDPRVSRLQGDLTKVMLSLVAQERRLATVLLEARNRLPKPFDAGQLEVVSGELDKMDDELYVAFEDEFRGTRQEIKDRVRDYLPTLKQAQAGTNNRPVLDVGCGRGEWLELLKEEGFTARGLDINEAMVEECGALGLDVLKGDVLKHLMSLEEESLGAVTGFHIIEHLPFKVWVRVFDEVLRALKQGGVAIFETPNPGNVLVGSNSFYLDPTHRNPLPSAMVKFIAEVRGFSRVEILNLHPVEATSLIREETEVAHRFNDYFYGPQDYAIVAWKGQQPLE